MVKKYLTMNDVDLDGKTVFLRIDINSPVDPSTGLIVDRSRFIAHKDTFSDLNNSKVVVLAHQSRPGKKDFTSLYQHSLVLSEVLKKKVKFVDGLFENNAIDHIKNLKSGEILLLENTRFYSEEVVLANDSIELQRKSQIVKKLAPLMDYFINDAFAAVHRPQPTLIAFAEDVPMIAGRLMDLEITMLTRFMESEERPKIAVFAGAKVNDSIKVAKHMLEKRLVDRIFTGGLVANLFLDSQGVNIGSKNIEVLKKEIEEYDLIKEKAKEIVDKYDNIIIPEDFAVSRNGERMEIKTADLPTEYQIMDIGIETMGMYSELLKNAKSIILNGPMGVYEIPEFATGTEEVFTTISNSKAFKVAGGGHTISAIAKMDISRNFDHISVGGGALISFLAGEKMPVIDALERSRLKFEKVII